MHDTFRYRETRPKLAWTGPLVFQDYGTTFPTTNNHVSMYCITQPTAQKILNSYTIKGHRKIEHYSEELIVDVESFDLSEGIKSICLEHNLQFQIYHTGNRGHHFHIRRQAIPSCYLYLQDKILAMEMFKEILFDTQIYLPLHTIRAIGCVHEKSKTGKRKELIFEHNGLSMLSTTQIPINTLLRNVDFHTTDTEIAQFTQLNMILANTRIKLREGQGRNRELFVLVCKLFRVGISERLAWEIVSMWNNSLAEPMDSGELDATFRSAMSQTRSDQIE